MAPFALIRLLYRLRRLAAVFVLVETMVKLAMRVNKMRKRRHRKHFAR